MVFCCMFGLLRPLVIKFGVSVIFVVVAFGAIADMMRPREFVFGDFHMWLNKSCL